MVQIINRMRASSPGRLADRLFEQARIARHRSDQPLGARLHGGARELYRKQPATHQIIAGSAVAGAARIKAQAAMASVRMEVRNMRREWARR